MLNGVIACTQEEDPTIADARLACETAARTTGQPQLLLRPGFGGRVVFETFAPSNDPQQNFTLPTAEAIALVEKSAGQVGLMLTPKLPLKVRSVVEQIAVTLGHTAGTA